MTRKISQRRPPSKTRVVGYDFAGKINIDAAVVILDLAVRENVVTAYTAKHYTDEDTVWFNGKPGEALRNVRDAIQKLVTT